MVIGCVEWVNPITHPTGLTLFGGLSVGQFVRYPSMNFSAKGIARGALVNHRNFES